MMDLKIFGASYSETSMTKGMPRYALLVQLDDMDPVYIAPGSNACVELTREGRIIVKASHMELLNVYAGVVGLPPETAAKAGL